MDERSREASEGSAIEEVIGPRYRMGQARIYGVTVRQLEVLECVADGMRQKEIAEEMGISINCANVHMMNLRDQLDAQNNAHAVAIGFRKGFLK